MVLKGRSMLFINKKYIRRGVWWRSDFPDKKIPGTLEIIRNRSIKLKTDDLFPTKNGVHYFPSQLGTILGRTLKGEQVTLIDCGNIIGEFYGSTFALIGNHYKNLDSVKFSSIKVFYTLLVEWMFEKNLKDNRVACKVEELGINIYFDITMEKSIKRKTGAKKELVSSVIIESENQKNLHEWWDIIILLRNFIILGLNTPVYPYNYYGIENSKKIVKMFRTTNTNFEEYSEQLRRKGTLFRLKDIKENINLYLCKLLQNSESLNRIMTNYYSILNNPEIYSADKFLNLVSILEGYHRYNMKNEEMPEEDFKRFKKEILKRAKLCLSKKEREFIRNKIYNFGYEKSLPKRLEEILENCKSFIPIKENERKNFVDKITYTRNAIAHNLKMDDEKVLKKENLYKAMEALEFLFVASVCKKIGFTDVKLKELISNFNKFNYPYNDIPRLFKV